MGEWHCAHCNVDFPGEDEIDEHMEKRHGVRTAAARLESPPPSAPEILDLVRELEGRDGD